MPSPANKSNNDSSGGGQVSDVPGMIISRKARLPTRGGREGFSLLELLVAISVLAVAVGLTAAVFVGRAAQSLLFGVEPTDPTVLAGVTLLVAASALAAAAIPARRAARVDPVRTLRSE